MKTDQAKSAILASIRRHLAESKPFDAVHAEHHVPVQKSASLMTERSFAENMPLVETDLTERNSALNFQKNLTAVGGNCVIVGDKIEAAAVVNEILASLNPQKIAVSDSPLIGEIRQFIVTEAEIAENVSGAELFGCDLGMTGAQFGIAETGTLVLEAEKEFNRLASLIPSVHVCLLKAADIYETLGETLTVLEKDLSRAVTFITGPSRTSDIELTLAIGVHGPGQLHVIILDEQSG